MPQIVPFRAYRYNSRRFPRLDKVLSPPYDVISDKDQAALYRLSPYNFVRLDLKKRKGRGNRFYKQTAQELKAWIEKKVFVPEDNPSLYVYLQDYKNPEGRGAKRIGFISLVKIDPRKVKKHEHTLSGPKKDRTALLKHLKANLSPIFSFFEDPGRRIHSKLISATRQNKIVDVRIAGVRERLYLLDDPGIIGEICRVLRDKPMYIADGHHRFEVSDQYYRSVKRNRPVRNGREKAAYVMTYLCAAEHNEMTIYPTHRALTLSGDWLPRFERLIRNYYTVIPCSSAGALMKKIRKAAKHRVAIGAVYRKPHGKIVFHCLALKKASHLMDVVTAQETLIKPLLRGENVAETRRVRYTRDPYEAMIWVKKRESQAAILLSKLPISKVIKYSDEGRFMPQKSTYFYPKLLSGLVFYKF